MIPVGDALYTELAQEVESSFEDFQPITYDYSHCIHQTLIKILTPFFPSIPINNSVTRKIECCEQKASEITNRIQAILPFDFQKASVSESAERNRLVSRLNFAIRYHLFLGLTLLLKKEIQQRFENSQAFDEKRQVFPKSLGKWESQLTNFLTRRGSYDLPIEINIVDALYEHSQLEDIMNTCVREGFFPNASTLEEALDKSDDHIGAMLEKLNLYHPSQMHFQLEKRIREILGKKYTSLQVEALKKQFEESGVVTPEQIQDVAKKLGKFIDGDQRFYHPTCGKLLLEIFDLELPACDPFRAHASKIEAKMKELKAQIDANQGYLGIFIRAEKQTLLEKEQKKLVSVNAMASWWEELSKQPLSLPSTLKFPLPFPREEFSIVPPPIVQKAVDLRTLPHYVAPSAPFIEEEPPLYQATQWNIPQVSYVDEIYAEQLQSVNDLQATWDIFPYMIKRDILRHAKTFSELGKAEKLAIDLFNGRVKEELVKFPHYYPNPKLRNQGFVTIGENLLNLYYSPAGDDPYKFWKRLCEVFENFAGEEGFYEAVCKVAKFAKIDTSDPEFGKKNWNALTMLPFTIQALERCLHVTNA